MANISVEIWNHARTASLPLDSNQAYETIPASVQRPDPIDSTSATQVLNLSDDEAGTQSVTWSDLYVRFSPNGTASGQNYAPWMRIIAIMKEHGAQTCVIEKGYVCLDYKSELASRYSQVDLDHTSTATRIHFFSAIFSRGQLEDLHGFGLSESYLGYVVARPAPLPLVGRTAIKPPSYISNAATIIEPVNLLGQQLTVRCAPFMQQDRNVDVCSNIALWIPVYMAYRRGLVRRHLISEIESIVRPILSMQPASSTGVTLKDAIEILGKVGLGAQSFHLNDESRPWIPRISAEHMPESKAEIQSLERKTRVRGVRSVISGESRNEDPSVNVGVFAAELVSLADGRRSYRGLRKSASELVDAVFSRVLAPYLASRMPVYVDYGDHAACLIGLGVSGGKWHAFIHDDQYGPYLATSSLTRPPISELEFQSEFPNLVSKGKLSIPCWRSQVVSRRERLEYADKRKAFSTEMRRAKHFLVALPPRALTIPVEADVAAREIVHNPVGHGSGRRQSISPWRTRTSLMMGIDYKSQRRSWFADPELGMLHSAQLFGSLRLAEWVVVVEGFLRTERATRPIWEIVYDGTAGAERPRIQFARFADQVLAHDPSMPHGGLGFLEYSDLPRIDVPDRVGKVRL